MKSSGRMKLFMSVGLCVMLIIQIIVYMLLRPGSLNMVVLLFGIIVLMAVLAVIANYYSLKKSEERVVSLPEDYRQFYIDASEAIGLSSMKKVYKKDTMSMILEILEHANEDHRSLDEVIGENKDQYIEGFIQASGGALTPLYLFGYSLSYFMFFVLIMKVYKLLKVGSLSQEVIQTTTLDVGIVVTYALIAFIFLPWLLIVMQKAAKNQWTGMKQLLVLIPFIIPLGLMALLIFIDAQWLRNILDIPLPILSSSFLLVLGIGLLITGILITQYARKKQLEHLI